ncbi:hypothetical protein [Roseovarius sp. SYSU LYC5161]|uniref:hypothetical protein n=1 Tax=Roseovarius halophilus (ex Wu et al. 2025) TaxID=3376060 RepID=UPI003999EF06
MTLLFTIHPYPKKGGRRSNFAKMELDRRTEKAAEDLAKKTTWISTGVGGLSAIIGAVVGALLIVNFGS